MPIETNQGNATLPTSFTSAPGSQKGLGDLAAMLLRYGGATVSVALGVVVFMAIVLKVFGDDLTENLRADTAAKKAAEERHKATAKKDAEHERWLRLHADKLEAEGG